MHFAFSEDTGNDELGVPKWRPLVEKNQKCSVFCNGIVQARPVLFKNKASTRMLQVSN